MLLGKQRTLSLTRSQKHLVTLMFFMAMLNYLDRQILAVLSPIIREDVGLSQVHYAWAVNAFLIAYAFMYVGSGVVLDRLGSRVGLVLFVATWSLASGLHAAIGGFMGLLVCRFLLGLTEPGGWTGAIKTISERFTAAQSGIATGFLTTGSSIATFLTPPLAVFISGHYGWRLTFLVTSLAGFIWIPFWLWTTRGAATPPLVVGTHNNGEAAKHGLLHLKDRRTLAYMATRFFGDSSGYFFLFWLPEYLITRKGFSFSMLGSLAWIPYFCFDLGPLAGGYAASRLILSGKPPVLSRKLMMSLAASMVAAGAMFQSSMQTWTVLMSLSLSLFGVGFWSGNLHAVATDAFPRKTVATIYGFAGSAGAVGGVLFNTLVGYLAGKGNYLTIFGVLVLLQPIGVGFLWLWLRDGITTPKQLSL